MKHYELYNIVKEQISADTPDVSALVPVLEYVQNENPTRLQEFVRFLAHVRQDLAIAAMDDRQLTLFDEQPTNS